MTAHARSGRRARLAVAALAAIVGVTMLVGCSSSGTGAASGSHSSATSGQASADTIAIKNFAFNPATLTVAPGAKVTVTNEDSVTHTLTAKTKSAFNTGDIAAGKTVTFSAPSKPGTYPYYCDIHQYMTGTLTVS